MELAFEWTIGLNLFVLMVMSPLAIPIAIILLVDKLKQRKKQKNLKGVRK